MSATAGLARAGFGFGRKQASGGARALPIDRDAVEALLDDPDALVPTVLPRSLRTGDVSFYHQVQSGVIRLGGETVVIDGYAPFEVAFGPGEAMRCAYGFDWLEDLRAAGGTDALDLMREWTRRWIGAADRFSRRDPAGPVARARRILNWLSHGDVLLKDVPGETFDALLHAIADEAHTLCQRWGDFKSAEERATAFLAIALVARTMPCCDHLNQAVDEIGAAAMAAVLSADGGHVSRNPMELVALLLDAVPVAKARKAAGRPLPADADARIERGLACLAALRLPDGSLARFNGVGRVARADIGRLMMIVPPVAAGCSVREGGGYVRVDRAGLAAVMDCGGAPPEALSRAAHAGCLSLEVVSDGVPVIINCGAASPEGAHVDAAALSRATASHSTLSLGRKSSARLAEKPGAARRGAGAVLIGQDDVRSVVSQRMDGDVEIAASHGGYVGEFGVRHWREIVISGDGREVGGVDRIAAEGHPQRNADDVGFAIHFHVPPCAEARLVGHGAAAEIVTRGGETWRLNASGVQISIERSTYFAGATGPEPCKQITLRGTTHGETSVAWRLVRAS